MQKMSGGEYLGFNNSIFLSERDTADRNSALGSAWEIFTLFAMISPKNENFIFFRYFMRENACYPPGDINIPNTLDFYFQVIIPQLYSSANLAT